ncbi:hypothetical protein B4N89_26800 [Embleya scabrispora]|uniref:Uncharacterized protein n=1 Tax=Embleya scabrispora TaxID=159449 RepID=A0A1T3P4M8_9ACTN|nr:hypothetical protein [Embleya scabrispora]OPC84057.1 hypothetical protein B4N89_26800 [Embleya scabrispora]
MSWLTVRRTGAVAACGAILVAAFPVFSASADAANPYAAQAGAAANRQAGEPADGGVPGFAGSDWGLAIDTMTAPAATREHA